MNLNYNKNYQITSKELQNIDKTTYIAELKIIIKGLEEQIKIKYPEEIQKEYINLLTDIKIKINEIEKEENFKLTQSKVKFLNILIDLRKKIYNISLTKKTELFMSYISNNPIPSQMSNIKFSDLQEEITDDTLIGKWYIRQLYGNSEIFQLEINKYKNLYPIAFSIITKRIDKLPQEKKITKTYEKKVELFMELIEENKISLPIKNKTITFNELEPKSNINSKIKTWFHNTVVKEKELFIKICLENKEKYPKAYKIITNYLERENKENRLDNETRTKLWLEYLETNKFPIKKERITFADVESNCQDYTEITTWFYRQISQNFKELTLYLEKYKNIYPSGYVKTNLRIKKYHQKKSTNDLTSIQKEEIFMEYIEKNSIPVGKDNIKFKDINENYQCEISVYNWFYANIIAQSENTLKLIEKYKDIYPNACIKLLKRAKELEHIRKNSPIKSTFQEKTKVFIKYIETNKIPSDCNKTRFCDIDNEIKDTTLIGNWFRDQLSKNLNNFIYEITKYKEIYKEAYLKIENRINNSEAMLKKQRNLLLQELYIIKDELSIKNQTKKYSKHN